MSGRDLSAFAPPSRRVALPIPPPGDPRPDTSRRKVMTSLPASLHRRLREVADAQCRFKADIVVEALRVHGGTLERDARARFRGRRRRVEDATQCQLYLTWAERRELDGLSEALGLSRSALVTELLERALAD